MDDLKIGTHRSWPRFEEEELERLLQFLAAYLSEAEEMYIRYQSLIREHGQRPEFTCAASYWRNAVRTIRWLAMRAPKRQRYLAIIDAMKQHQAASAK